MSGFLQLDDLLRGLTSEGEKDSSGVFTLELATALEKLAQFQMASPYQYCLRWLQAAVAGRARAFNWHSSPTLVSAEMEGFVLDPARISQLPTLLLEPEAGRAEQHLSAGLNAALRTRAKCIRLRSGNYQGIWKPGHFQIEHNGMGLDGTKIEMERHVALWRNLWTSRSPGGRDQEQDLLHHQAACAPLSLGVQGGSPDRIVQELAALYADSNPGERCFPAPPGVGFWVPAFNRSRRSPNRCWLYAIRRYGPSELFPVKDGVLLKPRRLDGLADWVVLADVSRLATDLTGLQLIENEEYRQFLDQLGRQLL